MRLKVKTNKQPNKTKVYAKNLNRLFSKKKKKIQMAKRHMKRRSTSLIITETQIKTTMRYHLTPVRMAIIKKSSLEKCLFRSFSHFLFVYLLLSCMNCLYTLEINFCQLLHLLLFSPILGVFFLKYSFFLGISLVFIRYTC